MKIQSPTFIEFAIGTCWLMLLVIGLVLAIGSISGCAWGPVPITVGAYGASATIVIPQKPATVVPVQTVDSVKEPTLLVPVGTATSKTATATPKNGPASVVPVIEAPVNKPTLAVPK